MVRTSEPEIATSRPFADSGLLLAMTGPGTAPRGQAFFSQSPAPPVGCSQ
ncbi:MAG TPA: hypothetical protein PLG59_19020 [bacterium]|nr:hypothetical protein [bacterium]